MARDVARDWMWSEAFEMLARAERMHRQFFRPAARGAPVAWEPPVDILETDREVLVLVALPGVDADRSRRSSRTATWSSPARAAIRASCAPRSSTGSSCRKAASSGGCGCRPAATAALAAPCQRLPADHAAESRSVHG